MDEIAKEYDVIVLGTGAQLLHVFPVPWAKGAVFQGRHQADS